MCGCDGIGRHAGFRFLCREACGFESLHPHQLYVKQKLKIIFGFCLTGAPGMSAIYRVKVPNTPGSGKC